MKRLTAVMIVIFAALYITVVITSAREICTGEVYDGHPALVIECQHQGGLDGQQGDGGRYRAYPGPEDEPAPYPEPEPLPTWEPRQMPTESPPGINP